MSTARHTVEALPLPARYAIGGGVVAGAVGAVVGLVLGLLAHPATAWAATAEVGLPAAALGALVGAAVGAALMLVQRRREGRADSDR